tara:strand:+ start:729 stop:1025 length:297 start_codon:yes stop_codon:yes gene_type:complete
MSNLSNIYTNILTNLERYLIFYNNIDDLPFQFHDSLYIEENLNYYINELYNNFHNNNYITITKKKFQKSVNNPKKYKFFLINILPNILSHVKSNFITK